MNIKTTGEIHQRLEALAASNKLPTVAICSGLTLYRIQPSGYTEGFFFWAPTDPTNMGRYADPNGKLAISYFAETPKLALAETYLRLGQPVILSHADLSIKDMATVQLKASADIRLLDMGQLLPLLGLQLDAISGIDYSLTQSITAFFAFNRHGIDGISYTGRHLAVNRCIVLFEPAHDVKLVTLSLKKVSRFQCPITLMDCEEILTDELGVTVTSI